MSGGTGRAVFLDRDGVLNRAVVRGGKPYPPATPEEIEILPDVPAALRRLKERGFLLLVATNQPDVARGTQTRSAVERMHLKLGSELPLDGFLVCYHDDSDHCDCRKPRPGLLIEAARRHDLDLARCYLVGDRWRDVDAGVAAGCKAIWIDRGYSERPPASAPSSRVASLREAVNWILLDYNGVCMDALSRLRVKLFADGADRAEMLALRANPLIRGFTTNPTLMRKAGVTDFEAFARDVLAGIPDLPLSFEVFDDAFPEMERQARKISGWGDNVYVKIPVTNARGEPATDLICRLSHAGVKVNVTAILSLAQVRDVVRALAGGAPAFVSVFAGRIADTGRDPVPLMAAAVELLGLSPNAELIWASPRELLNVFQADAVGCHIITATTDVLRKLTLVGKDLEEYSLETVQMFHRDAAASRLSI